MKLNGMSNFIWDLKKKNINVSLKWMLYGCIIDWAKSYSGGSRNCMLA